MNAPIQQLSKFVNVSYSFRVVELTFCRNIAAHINDIKLLQEHGTVRRIAEDAKDSEYIVRTLRDVSMLLQRFQASASMLSEEYYSHIVVNGHCVQH